MKDLTAMAVFAAVVEAGGFTAAARQLGLSKSAVSKRVARLEAQLGVRGLNPRPNKGIDDQRVVTKLTGLPVIGAAWAVDWFVAFLANAAIGVGHE